MKERIKLITVGLILVAITAVMTQPTDAETNGLRNVWALGIDNASGCPGDIGSGWTHSATVSLSRCPKNPSPDGMSPGAAFKNGPVSGGGQAGIETTSSQLFTLPYAESHELTFSALIVCVRCNYLIADLYGDGVYLGELLDFTEGMASCGGWTWPRYCGQPLTVAHAAEYEIVIRTLWTQSNSLGIKWTGLQLIDSLANEATSTPMLTATSTPAATATETAVPGVTATPSPFPTITPAGGRWCMNHPDWPGC